MIVTNVTQKASGILIWVVGTFFILALFFVAAKELGLIEWYYEVKAEKKKAMMKQEEEQEQVKKEQKKSMTWKNIN